MNQNASIWFRSDPSMSKFWLMVLALAIAIGAYFLLGNQNVPTLPGASGIPDNYYFSLKKADVDSPLEAIRFATSIRPYTSDFSISERLAFFEWYFKNRGFDISFAYSDNFDYSGKSHTWLIIKNKLGEIMSLEPNYVEMKADSIFPIASVYKRYSKQYKDIYELSRATGGSGKYAWWNKNSGQRLWNENIILLKDKQL